MGGRLQFSLFSSFLMVFFGFLIVFFSFLQFKTIRKPEENKRKPEENPKKTRRKPEKTKRKENHRPSSYVKNLFIPKSQQKRLLNQWWILEVGGIHKKPGCLYRAPPLAFAYNTVRALCRKPRGGRLSGTCSLKAAERQSGSSVSRPPQRALKL